MAKRPNYTSPVGTLYFPKLNTPTQFKGKGEPFYEAALDVAGGEGVKFEAALGAYAHLYGQRVGAKIDISGIAGPATAKDGERKVVIPDMTRVKFKVRAETPMRDGTVWNRKPSFVDALGLPFDEEPQIWGGTTCAIVYDIYEWEAQGKYGMTLQPLQIRIVELVTDNRDLTEIGRAHV